MSGIDMSNDEHIVKVTHCISVEHIAIVGMRKDLLELVDAACVVEGFQRRCSRGAYRRLRQHFNVDFSNLVVEQFGIAGPERIVAYG